MELRHPSVVVVAAIVGLGITVSPDTGAREPQDSVSELGQRAAEIRERAELALATRWPWDEAGVEPPAVVAAAADVARDVVALLKENDELRAALAAGVGVPPDKDLVSAPAKERQDARRVYEAVIKVNVTDDPARRAQDIAEGIGYACALLMDEYGWTADRIGDVLERAQDDVQDQEAQRS